MKTIPSLFLISSLCYANENIVEFKNDKTPLTFKYDKREYDPEIIGSKDDYTLLTWKLSAKQLGKKESICTDKTYNKHHCPDLWIIIKNQNKSNYRKQKIKKDTNNLEWHIIDTNPKMYSKFKRETSPVKLDKENWSQTIQEVGCHKDLDKKNVFGHFSFYKTFYNKEFNTHYRLSIEDTIFVTLPTPDINEFKREDFCENNEALLNWNVGSHAHMLMNSIKINPEFFKKLKKK